MQTKLQIVCDFLYKLRKERTCLCNTNITTEVQQYWSYSSQFLWYDWLNSSPPPVWGHGGRPMGLTGSLYPTLPWTWSWVTVSGSCCHLDGSAQGRFVTWVTCRGRQSSTSGWSCWHLITDCMMVATGDKATLNGNWRNIVGTQPRCSFFRVISLTFSAELWWLTGIISLLFWILTIHIQILITAFEDQKLIYDLANWPSALKGPTSVLAGSSVVKVFPQPGLNTYNYNKVSHGEQRRHTVPSGI